MFISHIYRSFCSFSLCIELKSRFVCAPCIRCPITYFLNSTTFIFVCVHQKRNTIIAFHHFSLRFFIPSLSTRCAPFFLNPTESALKLSATIFMAIHIHIHLFILLRVSVECISAPERFREARIFVYLFTHISLKNRSSLYFSAWGALPALALTAICILFC